MLQLFGGKTKGKPVVVAIIDSGCDTAHPDLTDRIIGGKNFTADWGGDSTNYNDNNGHGTHVAGGIALIVSASKLAGTPLVGVDQIKGQLMKYTRGILLSANYVGAGVLYFGSTDLPKPPSFQDGAAFGATVVPSGSQYIINIGPFPTADNAHSVIAKYIAAGLI